MEKIVILSGAGISAESGIETFRGGNGLWDNYNVEDVASIDGWHKNRELVLKFYNIRRREIEKAQPNSAHIACHTLESKYDVTVVTQNVDDLHERGGSSNIIHLHGEITKVRSEKADWDPNYYIGYKDINIGDKAPDGGQLRPHIVWFGEAVPELARAAKAVEKADILIIIGTSLNGVFPLAYVV